MNKFTDDIIKETILGLLKAIKTSEYGVDEVKNVAIAEKIIDRLENNPNFEFIQNPTGYIFDNIVGYNVFGCHGETKSMEQAIKDFKS